MRILFLSQYYPPEMGAAANRVGFFARRLAEWGHTVTVITAVPNYPHGQVREGYRGRLVMESDEANVRVLRCWVYATRKGGLLPRLLNYFSFVVAASLTGLCRAGRQDVVVVESPPLFVGISGLLIRRFCRASLVFNVSDLWPETAIALNALRSRFLIWLSTALEELLYRHSDLITGQTAGIVQNIRTRVPSVPVVLITNGADVGQYLAQPVHRRAKKELGLEENFLVGYTGLHGLAQGLQTVLEAAAQIRNEKPIRFVFFGDGPEKPELVEMARNMALENVHFFPAVPQANMPDVLASLDVAVVPLRRNELFWGALPSKLFEAMAASLPVILCAEGEARRVVLEAEGGICVPPEDAHALAEAVLRLYRDASLRKIAGEKGREYVQEKYDRVRIAKVLEQQLVRLENSHQALRSHV